MCNFFTCRDMNYGIFLRNSNVLRWTTMIYVKDHKQVDMFHPFEHLGLKQPARPPGVLLGASAPGGDPSQAAGGEAVPPSSMTPSRCDWPDDAPRKRRQPSVRCIVFAPGRKPPCPTLIASPASSICGSGACVKSGWRRS